jgi:hypothetical protein
MADPEPSLSYSPGIEKMTAPEGNMSLFPYIQQAMASLMIAA